MEQKKELEKTGGISRKKFFGLSIMGFLGITFLSSTRSTLAQVATRTSGKLQAKLNPNAVKRQAKSVKNG